MQQFPFFWFFASCALMAPYLTWVAKDIDGNLVIKAAIKSIPVVLLASTVLASAVQTKVEAAAKSAKYIAIGLVFSSLGDVSLALEAGAPIMFLAGLVSFLIGHIFYIIAFSKSPLPASPGQYAAGLPVYAAGMGIFLYLLPFIQKNEPDKLIPVLFYVFVISTMAHRALIRRPQSNASYLLCVIGSILFMISDSVLATAKFALPIPNAHMIVMCTYYSAQVLIAAGATTECVAPRQHHE